MNTENKMAIILIILISFFLSNLAMASDGAKAVITTITPDWSASAYSIISVEPPRTATNKLVPIDVSDTTIISYGPYFFRLFRGSVEKIEKYNISTPTSLIWDYSTLESEQATNPQDIVFASLNQAYMLRFLSSKVPILDLSGNDFKPSLSHLKTGELDLSDYADSDGSPEPVQGIIVGNKLFILMQFIDRTGGWKNYVYNKPYIAVFDIKNNVEIDTEIETGIKGIPLPIINPASIQYIADNNRLYIQAIGQYPSSENPAKFAGGIVEVDPTTFQVKMILDDGDENSHPYGNITGMGIISPNKGYFIGYAGWGDNSIYPFNPMTGEVYNAIAELEHKNLSGMISGLYLDKNQLFWLSNASDAQIEIIDPATDSIVQSVSTELNPQRVVFCTSQLFGSISGKIESNGQAIPNAQVFISGTNITAWTDVDGLFNLINVPSGVQSLRVKAFGYMPLVISNVNVEPLVNTELPAQAGCVLPMMNSLLSGDSNADGIVDLKDVILSLQIMTKLNN
ncbi:conserved hypothetical protein, secreted [Candidatus Magnetomorum sp. HK-1]|nr:conserved hypothetical protein, secreted [Candidatus Magnetomorum sp. HK-1]